MMKIDFLPRDYLINVTRDVEGGMESDFLLRALKIKNNTRSMVEVKKISFAIKIKGMVVREVSYSGKTLGSMTRNLVKNVMNLEVHIARMFLGTENFWEPKLMSRTPGLAQGQETGLLLEHFRIVQRKQPVCECAVTVLYLEDGNLRSAHKRIPVLEYVSRNSYIFPVKGTWLVVNNYDDIHVHRRMHSQEFAMDLIQLSSELKIAPDTKSSNEEHVCYGKDIYAIADGEVVDCSNDLPENPPGFGSRLPKDEWDELKAKHGFVAGIAGNYVILKHVGEEHSFYAHMICGSVPVRKGERVRQGQPIGRVGNSGNSEAPHLHFHLMAGSSILSARGLPCRFSNLTHIIGEEHLNLITEDLSIVNAE